MRLRSIALACTLALLGCARSQEPVTEPGAGPGPEMVPVTDVDTGDLRPLQQRVVIQRLALPAGGAPSYPGLEVDGGQLVLVGVVDWEEGVLTCPGLVTVVGEGRIAWAKAERGVRAAAFGNAVKLAAGVQLDAARTLEVKTGSFDLAATIRGGAGKLSDVRKFEAAKLICATATVALNGVDGLSAKVLAEEYAEPQELGYYEADGEGKIAFEGGTPTDIIIDGRGKALTPAVMPRIVTEGGQVVYDVHSCEQAPEQLVEYAVADEGDGVLGALPLRLPGGRRPVRLAHRELPDVLLQLAQRRRGRRQVKAVVAKHTGAEGAVDVIVSEKDAARIRAAEAQGKVLSKGRVIVVVGSRVAGKRGWLTPDGRRVAVARR